MNRLAEVTSGILCISFPVLPRLFQHFACQPDSSVDPSSSWREERCLSAANQKVSAVRGQKSCIQSDYREQLVGEDETGSVMINQNNDVEKGAGSENQARINDFVFHDGHC